MLTMSRSTKKGRPYLLSPEQERVVEEYRAYMRAAGLCADKSDTWGGRAFFAKFANTEGWHALSLGEQLSVNVKIGRFVVWMIATQRLVPTPEYVVAHRPLLGRVVRRAEADFYLLFQATAHALGFDAAVVSQQWASLAQVAAVTGKRPQEISQAELDRARPLCARPGASSGAGRYEACAAPCLAWRLCCSIPGSPTSSLASEYQTVRPNGPSNGRPSL